MQGDPPNTAAEDTDEAIVEAAPTVASNRTTPHGSADLAADVSNVKVGPSTDHTAL